MEKEKMALFGRNEKAKSTPKPRPAPRTVVDSAADDVRLIDNVDGLSIRRNVPAVALGTQRRPTVTLAMPANNASGPYGRQEPSAGEKRLIVGKDIALAGEIAECDQLVVEGTMDATLRAGKRLDIYESGIYRGAANVQEADIAGEFNGELNVAGRLRLRATSKISGTVRYSEIEVESGAKLSGEFHFVEGAVTSSDDGEMPSYRFTTAA